MIGEVWVCSGQSNMEFNHYYEGSKDIEPELKKSIKKYSLVSYSKNYSETSAGNCSAQWTVSDSNTLKTLAK